MEESDGYGVENEYENDEIESQEMTADSSWLLQNENSTNDANSEEE